MYHFFRFTLERLVEVSQAFAESYRACVLDYVSHACAAEVAARARRSSVLQLRYYEMSRTLQRAMRFS